MKNPRVTLTAGEIRASNTEALPVADKKSDPLNDALQFLKFSDEEIKTIDVMKDAIVSLASTLNWAVAAVNTIKGVLTLLGVFEPAKDNTLIALQAIGQRLNQIYGYLASTEKNSQYEQAQRWRDDLSGLRNAVNNLSISRAPLNLSEARQHADDLQSSLLEMLAFPFGSIPFQRSTYGYKAPGAPFEVPPHWIDYAVPFFMAQYDGAPVNYGDPQQELQARIWDPGYYFDVLVQSLELRILALSATEPAFRSTGLDRENLRQLYDALETFIETWQKTMLRTNVIGPIDPGLTVGGPAGIAHPLHGVWYSQTSIPLGVVDPVSGISELNPTFNQGFELYWVSYNDPSGDGYWVLGNYDAAVTSANSALYQAHASVLSRCGIATLQSIKDAIGDMIVGPSGSEFVDFSPVLFRTGALQKLGDELVSLGLVGQYSSHPNKTYSATRYLQNSTEKVFVMPMARRTDVSQVQLGYALGISFADDEPEQQIVLCPYSPSTPNAPAFPSEAIQQTLQSDSTTVYDVYQSAIFSIDEEEQWENNGSIAPAPAKFGYKAYGDATPQRLFTNPHKGQIRTQISITFEPGPDDGTFLGAAIISVTNLNPAQYRDGFMIAIRAYETTNSTTGVHAPDAIVTKMADAITLHFEPTFLVVGDDYFADRKEGLQRMGKMLSGINQRYVHGAPPGPIPDPLSNITNVIRQEQALEETFQTFRLEAPEDEALLRSRFQRRAVATERGEVDVRVKPAQS